MSLVKINASTKTSNIVTAVIGIAGTHVCLQNQMFAMIMPMISTIPMHQYVT
ncbi:MAG: hypothetical protein K5881_08715 [Saccharofermentans sp.]|nr:hypothetical protein [Saccharofermentans sp.]